MSRQIIKQPDGKYAIWSSIVDDFILVDITKEEYVQFSIVKAEKEVRKDLDEVFKAVDSGHPEMIYLNFAMTYEEALERKKEVHG